LPLCNVDWDDTAISGPNLLGMSTCIPWQEIADCQYEPTMRALKVISKDGSVIWVADYFLGFNEFCGYVKVRLPECSYVKSMNETAAQNIRGAL
jgi:hypothetical protein